MTEPRQPLHSSAPRAALSALAAAAGLPLAGDDRAVTGIALDSRSVNPGDLFVAMPGANVDGARFIDGAVSRGAVAICARAPHERLPTIVAENPRAAAAVLAAELNGHPARKIELLGVTGSLGKTSTALLAEAALVGGEIRTGVIGSLGIRYRGRTVQTGMTTPEAPAMHGALRRMVERGVDVVVMEVTTHSIRLHRVDGLELSAGAFTNLVADEHLDFHPDAEDYVRTKLRFLEMLRPGAPLFVCADDALVRERVEPLRECILVGFGRHADQKPDVALRLGAVTARGSRFTLMIRRPIPTVYGGEIPPMDLEVELPLLGRAQVGNAALGAMLAMAAGARPELAVAGLHRVRPIRRRTQVIHPAAPLVLDDTVGNARSIRAVFDAARLLQHERLRVAFAIRGSRGAAVNENNARALASEVVPLGAQLIVTASEDAAGPRDRVTDEEREVVLATLHEGGVSFQYEPNLEDAVHHVLDGARSGDLVLLLGAQGMDAGADFALRILKPGAAAEFRM